MAPKPEAPEPPKPGGMGHFEQLLITAIMTLGGESYGVPIYDEVSSLAERHINQGSMYITLDRLEEKGYLSSWLSDPAKEPRGRSKRYYRLEPAGLRALQESLETAKRLTEVYDDNSGRIRRWLSRHIKLSPDKA